MRPDTRRLLTVLVVGLLLSGLGAVVVERTTEAPAVAVDNPVAEVPVSTTVAAPAGSSTTTTVRGPVTPPADPYAAEPIVEIGTIEIPKIGLVHRLYHGISLRNIDKGPSHWPGTAMPGENGNVVIAGHRVTHSRPFRNIDKLVAGDEVVFDLGGVRTVYLVTESFVVTPRRVDIADPTPTPTATLFACHPPGSAKQRYVVRLALRP
ncbi:MAG TPA: class E sortase [Acidimicrobiales bacterium]|nr:class E sortase [Acidimicrobiales bacterium]